MHEESADPCQGWKPKFLYANQQLKPSIMFWYFSKQNTRYKPETLNEKCYEHDKYVNAMLCYINASPQLKLSDTVCQASSLWELFVNKHPQGFCILLLTDKQTQAVP